MLDIIRVMNCNVNLKVKMNLIQSSKQQTKRNRERQKLNLRPLGRNVTPQNLFTLLWVPGVEPDTWTEQQKAEDLCLYLVLGQNRRAEYSVERFLCLSHFNIIYSCTFYCLCRHLKLSEGRLHSNKSGKFVVETANKNKHSKKK